MPFHSADRTLQTLPNLIQQCGEVLTSRRRSPHDRHSNRRQRGLADWAHEKESRLTLTGSWDFSGQIDKKVQYHFSELQGIIFGMNTPTSDKLRIMKIIEEKCRKEGRNDFEFHQAHYSRRAGKMEITKMDLIKCA